MDVLLYVIILGLVLNLLANMIFKYLPRMENRVDIWATCAMVVICVLLLINNSRRGSIPLPTNSNSHATDPTRDPHSQDPSVPDSSRGKSWELIDIIKQQQRNNVRESYGILAGQCFTDEDLDRFNAAGVARTIAEKLKQDKQFIEVVSAIKKMDPSERQKLLNTCLQTYHQTWQQLRRISSAGQTEAGQQAEREIAEAIVNAVKELIE